MDEEHLAAALRYLVLNPVRRAWPSTGRALAERAEPICSGATTKVTSLAPVLERPVAAR